MPKSMQAPKRQKSRRVYLDARGPWPHPCHFCGKPVDGYTRPCDSASSVIHHVDGNHWNNALANLVPMHFGCHKESHKIESQKRLFSTRTLAHTHKYRAIFLAFAGSGPWPCYFCGEAITNQQGRRGDCLDIHHLDEDPTNNQPTNLAPIHRGCHTKLHRTGTSYSPQHCANISAGLKRRYATTPHPATGTKRTAEVRAKMSASSKGRVPWTKGRHHSAETRAKIGAAHKGKVASPETRAKLSAASKGRKYSPEVRAKLRAGWTPERRAKMSAVQTGRKKSPETRTKISAGNKGKILSPETRAKISAAHTGKSRPPERTFACQHCGRELRGSLLARHERACTLRS